MIRLPEIKTAELSTYGNFTRQLPHFACGPGNEANIRALKDAKTRLLIMSHRYTVGSSHLA